MNMAERVAIPSVSDPKFANELESELSGLVEGEVKIDSPEASEPTQQKGQLSESDALGKAAVHDPDSLLRFMNAAPLRADAYRQGVIAEEYVPSERTQLSDYPATFGAGTLQLLQGVTSFVNMFAPEGGAVDEATQALAGYFYDKSEDIIKSLPKETQTRLRKEFLTTEAKNSAFLDPSAFLLKLANTAPSVLPSLAVGLGVKLMGASRFAAASAGGAMEGVLGGGDVASSIRNEIEAIPQKEFRKRFPQYTDLPLNAAREAAINERRLMVVPIVGVLDTALGGTGLGKLIGEAERGAKLARRAKVGFAQEALTEAPQSFQEQLFQNVATREPDVLEGTGEAAVTGALMGGPIGAGMGVMFPSAPAEDTEEKRDEEGALPTEYQRRVDRDVEAAIQAARESGPYVGGAPTTQPEPEAPSPYRIEGDFPQDGGGGGGGFVAPQPTTETLEPSGLPIGVGRPVQKAALDIPLTGEGMVAEEQPVPLPPEVREGSRAALYELRKQRAEQRRRAFNDPQERAAAEEVAKVQRGLRGEFAGQLELPLEPSQRKPQTPAEFKSKREAKQRRKQARVLYNKGTGKKLRRLRKQAEKRVQRALSAFDMGAYQTPEERKNFENLFMEVGTELRYPKGQLKKALKRGASDPVFEDVFREAYADERYRDRLLAAVPAKRGLAKGGTEVANVRDELVSARERAVKTIAQHRDTLKRLKAEYETKMNELNRKYGRFNLNYPKMGLPKEDEKLRQEVIDAQLGIELLKNEIAGIQRKLRNIKPKRIIEGATRKPLDDLLATLDKYKVKEVPKERMRARQMDLFPAEEERALREKREEQRKEIEKHRAEKTRKFMERKKAEELERQRQSEVTKRKVEQDKPLPKETEEKRFGKGFEVGPEVVTEEILANFGYTIGDEESLAQLIGKVPTRDVRASAKAMANEIRKALAKKLGSVDRRLIEAKTTTQEARDILTKKFGKGEEVSLSRKERQTIIKNAIRLFKEGKIPGLEWYKGRRAQNYFEKNLSEAELQKAVTTYLRRGGEADKVTLAIAKAVEKRTKDILKRRAERKGAVASTTPTSQLLLRAAPIELKQIATLRKTAPSVYREVMRGMPDYLKKAIAKIEPLPMKNFEQALEEAVVEYEADKQDVIDKYQVRVPDVSIDMLTEEQAESLNAQVDSFLNRISDKLEEASREQARDLGVDLAGTQQLLGYEPSKKLIELLTALDLTSSAALNSVDNKVFIAQLRTALQHFIDIVRLQNEILTASEETKAELQKQLKALEKQAVVFKGTALGKVLRKIAVERAEIKGEEDGRGRADTGENAAGEDTAERPRSTGSPEGAEGGTGLSGLAGKYNGVPAPSQVDGATRALKRVNAGKSFLIADSTGFGKTIQLLMVGNEFLEKNPDATVLVVLLNADMKKAFERDAKRLGIDLDRFEFDTFQGLVGKSHEALQGMNPDLVLVDEAHKLKNLQSDAKYRTSFEALTRNGSVPTVFATATPADNLSHLTLYAYLEGQTPAKFYESIGLELDETGKGEIRFKDGRTIQDVLKTLAVKIKSMKDAGAMTTNTADRDVVYKARTVPSTELTVPFADGSSMSLKEYDQEVAKAKPQVRLAASRYGSELAKIDEVASLVKEALDSGRQVVVSLSRRSEFKVKVSENKTLVLPAPTEVLSAKLKDMGVEHKVVVGKSQSSQAVEQFQKGELPVLITTAEKLGTGVDLDDQTGDNPRTLIFTNFGNYSAIMLDQMVGRIARRSTKSQGEVYFVTTDSWADSRERVSTAVKVGILKTVRGGKVSKLPTTEILEAGITRPYEFGEGVDEQGYVPVRLNTAFFADAYGTLQPALNLLQQNGVRYNKDSGTARIPKENVAEVQSELDEIVSGLLPKRNPPERNWVGGKKRVRRFSDEEEALFKQIMQEAGLAGEITSANLLDEIHKRSKDPTLRKLARLLKQTGIDIPVELQMDLGYTRDGKKRIGSYLFDIGDKYQPVNQRILLDINHFEIHTFLHEMFHAVQVHALTRNSNIARRLDVIRKKFIAAAEAYGINPNEHHGFKDVGEFVAEVSVNPEFQAVMRKVMHDEKLTLWERFKEIVHKSLKFLTGRNIRISNSLSAMYEEALDASMSLIQSAEEIQASDVRESFFENYRKYADDATAELGADYAASVASNMVDPIGVRSWTRRRVKLPFMTGRQIAESYGNRFKPFKPLFGDDVNALDYYMRLQGLRDRMSHKLQLETFPLTREWEEFQTNYPTRHGRMVEVMMESSASEIDPTVGFNHENNAHLRQNAKGDPLHPLIVQANKDKHRSLRRKYLAMGKQEKKIFNEAKDYYRKRWEQLTSAIRANLLYDPDIMRVVGANSMESLMSYAESLADEKVLDRLKDKLEASDLSQKVVEQLISDLKEINTKARIKGAYFPRRRFGEYVVSAYGEEKMHKFDTAEAAKIEKQLLKSEDPELQISGIKQFEEGTYGFTTQAKVVEFFEHASEAEQRRQQYKEEGYTKISNVMHKDSYFQQERVSSTFLERALKNVKDDSLRASLRLTLLQMMPEGSIRKAEMYRKNVTGASDDLLRAYAAHSRSSAFYMAQMHYGVQIQEAMQELHRQASESKYQAGEDTMTLQDVVNELRIRDNLAASMPFRAKTEILTELGFVSYLTSPSYWFINATQPLLITQPWLAARYGGKEARQAMASAYRAVMPEVMKKMKGSGFGFGWLKGQKEVPPELFDFLSSDGKIGPELIENIQSSDGIEFKQGVVAMLMQLGETNLIDMTFAADVKALAEGYGKNKFVRGKKNVIDWARVMPHLIEVLNRTVTATAAYELARKNGASHPQAVRAAEEAVATTQFDYSAINKPRYFSEKQFTLARPVFMFMQHMQHMYYLMLRSLLLDGLGKKAVKSLLGQGPELTAEEKERAKTAIKTFLYITGSHMAVAGTIGGLFEPIKWAIGLALWMLSGLDDDDEYFDPEVAYRNFLAETFGEKGGQIIAKGLPAAFGMDLSTRINLNRLMFFNSPVQGEGREMAYSLVDTIGGPLWAMTTNILEGAKNLAEGDVIRGTEQLMVPLPKLFRDMIRVVRYANEGVLDSGGNLILAPKDISPWDLFQQASGISPLTITETYERRRAVTGAKRYYQREKSKLMERYRRASPAERARMRVIDIPQFNRSVPSPEMKIKPAALRQSLRQKQRIEQSLVQHGGALLGKSEEALYRKYGGF